MMSLKDFNPYFAFKYDETMLANNFYLQLIRLIE